MRTYWLFQWIAISLLVIGIVVIPVPVAADEIPDEAYIQGVSGHAQSHRLSCEARSAADLAGFWGVTVSEETILDMLSEDENPNQGFVGNPDDAWGYVPPNSYGVHAGPIARALKDLGVDAQKHRHMTWDDLRVEVSAGRPVIVWIIGQMWSGTPQTYTTSTGDDVIVAAFEHTMLVFGYAENQVNVLDPYSGSPFIYDKTSFLESWKVLEYMAVTASGAKPVSTYTPAAGTTTITVQKGEYVRLLADRYEVDWQRIVDLNNLSYPYTIHPGQILILPIHNATETSLPLPTLTPSATAIIIPTESKVTPTRRSTITAPPIPTASLPSISPTQTQTPTTHPPPPTPIPTLNEKPSEYVVQRGDYLIKLARKFGVNWRTLAEVNQIAYPWIIVPGQVLIIP